MGLFGDVVKGVEEGIEEAGKIGKKVVNTVADAAGSAVAAADKLADAALQTAGAAADAPGAVAGAVKSTAQNLASDPGGTVQAAAQEVVSAGAVALEKLDKWDQQAGEALGLPEIGEQFFGRTEEWKDEFTSGEFDAQERWIKNIAEGVLDPKEDLSFEDFFSFGVTEDEAAEAYANKSGLSLWFADNFLYRPSSYVGAGLPGRVTTKGGLLLRGARLRGGAARAGLEGVSESGRGSVIERALLNAGDRANKVESSLDSIIAAPIVYPAKWTGKGVRQTLRVPFLGDAIKTAAKPITAPVSYLTSHASDAIVRMNVDILSGPMRGILYNNNPGTPLAFQQNIARIFAENADPKQLTPDELLARNLWDELASTSDSHRILAENALTRLGTATDEVAAQRIVDDTIERAVKGGFRFKQTSQVQRVREYHGFAAAQPFVNGWKKYVSDKVLNPLARWNLKFAAFAPLNIAEDVIFSMAHGTPMGGMSLENVRHTFSTADADPGLFRLAQGLPVVKPGTAAERGLGLTAVEYAARQAKEPTGVVARVRDIAQGAQTIDPSEPLTGRRILRAMGEGLMPTVEKTPEHMSGLIRINAQANATLGAQYNVTRRVAENDDALQSVRNLMDFGPQTSAYHGPAGSHELRNTLLMHLPDEPQNLRTALERMYAQSDPLEGDVLHTVSAWKERPPGLAEQIAGDIRAGKPIDETMATARRTAEASASEEIISSPQSLREVLDTFGEDLTAGQRGIGDPGGTLEHLEMLNDVYSKTPDNIRAMYERKITATTPVAERARIYAERDKVVADHFRENGPRMRKLREELRRQLDQSGYQKQADVGRYKSKPSVGVTAVKKESNSMINQIMDRTKDGGFTYQPIGRTYRKGGVHTGYGVSEAGGEVFPATELNQQRLVAFAEKNRDRFLEKDIYFGAWRDENNMVHLDITRIVRNRDEAIVAGKLNNQQSIFDYKANESIPVPENAPTFGAGDVRDGMVFHLNRLEMDNVVLEQAWKEDKAITAEFFGPSMKELKDQDPGKFYEDFRAARDNLWARTRLKRDAIAADYKGMSPSTYAQRVRAFGAKNVQNHYDVELAQRLADANRVDLLGRLRTPDPELLTRKMKAFDDMERDVRTVVTTHQSRATEDHVRAWIDEVVRNAERMKPETRAALRAGRKASYQHGARVRDAAFVNYDNKTVGDEFVRNTVSQYWMYQSRRPLRLGRVVLKYPGVARAFTQYMLDTEGGYIPIPGTDLQISPARFGITAPARSFQRVAQDTLDFIKTGDPSRLTYSEYDGWKKYTDLFGRYTSGVGLAPGAGLGGASELLGGEGEFQDVGGMIPNIILTPGQIAAGLQESGMEQYLPQPVRGVWNTLLGGYTDLQISILDRLGNRYFDYYTNQELLSQDILPSEATDEQIRAAQQKVMTNQLFMEQTGAGKFRPEEFAALEAEAREMALEFGVPESVLNNLRPTSSPISALFARDSNGEPYLNTAELRRVYEIHPEWKQWSQIYEPFATSSEREKIQRRREYETEQAEAYRALERRYASVFENALKGAAGVTPARARELFDEMMAGRREISATYELLYNKYGIYEGSADATRTAEDIAATKYYGIRADQFRDPGSGEIDWDAYNFWREAELAKYDPATQDYILNDYKKEMFTDPSIKAYAEIDRIANDQLEPYWEIADSVFNTLKQQKPDTLGRFANYTAYQTNLREREQLDGQLPGTYDNSPEAKWIKAEIKAVRDTFLKSHPEVDLALTVMWENKPKFEVVEQMAKQYGLQVFVNGALVFLKQLGAESSGLIKPSTRGRVDSFRRSGSAQRASRQEMQENMPTPKERLSRFKSEKSKLSGRQRAGSDPYGFDLPNRMGALFPEEPLPRVPVTGEGIDDQGVTRLPFEDEVVNPNTGRIMHRDQNEGLFQQLIAGKTYEPGLGWVALPAIELPQVPGL